MKDKRIALGCPFCGTHATDIEWEPLLRMKTGTVVKVRYIAQLAMPK